MQIFKTKEGTWLRSLVVSEGYTVHLEGLCRDAFSYSGTPKVLQTVTPADGCVTVDYTWNYVGFEPPVARIAVPQEKSFQPMGDSTRCARSDGKTAPSYYTTTAFSEQRCVDTCTRLQSCSGYSFLATNKQCRLFIAGDDAWCPSSTVSIVSDLDLIRVHVNGVDLGQLIHMRHAGLESRLNRFWQPPVYGCWGHLGAVSQKPDKCPHTVCEGDHSTCTGCTDAKACNHAKHHVVSVSSSCKFAKTHYDCNGVCTSGVDCFGQCGGTAQVDKCGVCGGNDATCVGCMNKKACSYDKYATISNEKACILVKPHHNCGDVCTSPRDCAGVCGGTKKLDKHKVCGGTTDPPCPTFDCAGNCLGENGVVVPLYPLRTT